MQGEVEVSVEPERPVICGGASMDFKKTGQNGIPWHFQSEFITSINPSSL
jgi:hypothetical protein